MHDWSVLKAAAVVIAMVLIFSPSAHAYGGHHGSHYGGHYRYGYHGGYRYYHRPYYYSSYHGRYGHHHRPYYYSGYGDHSPLYSLLSLPATLAYHILKLPAYILAGPYASRGYYYKGDRGAGRDHSLKPGAGDSPTQPRKNDPKAPGQQGGTRVPDSASWDALVQGRYREALRYFASEAQANPLKGGPKVGYALTAAAGGDLDRGVWAMKRALQYDAEALHYLQGDIRGINLQTTLDELISRYQARMNTGHSSQGEDGDAGLMVASLYYLGGNLDAARQAVAETRQYSSTNNLARLDDLIRQHETRAGAVASPPSVTQDGAAIAGR